MGLRERVEEVKIGNTLTTGKWDDRDTKAKLATFEKPIIEILRRIMKNMREGSIKPIYGQTEGELNKKKDYRRHLIWSCEMLTFTRAIPITLPGQETQNTHGMYILSTFTARLFPLPRYAGNVMFTVTLWHYRDRVFLFRRRTLVCLRLPPL